MNILSPSQDNGDDDESSGGGTDCAEPGGGTEDIDVEGQEAIDSVKVWAGAWVSFMWQIRFRRQKSGA